MTHESARYMIKEIDDTDYKLTDRGQLVVGTVEGAIKAGRKLTQAESWALSREYQRAQRWVDDQEAKRL